MPVKKDEQDLGQAEVQQTAQTAEEKGYLGQKVDPRPNSAYSLESGPDAPPLHDEPGRIHIDDLKEDARA